MSFDKGWVDFGVTVLMLGAAMIATVRHDAAAAAVTVLLGVYLLLSPEGGDDE